MYQEKTEREMCLRDKGSCLEELQAMEGMWDMRSQRQVTTRIVKPGMHVIYNAQTLFSSNEVLKKRLDHEA